MVKKLIRRGKVGVIISPGWGAGWSTWNSTHAEEMLFSPEIIKLVKQKATTEEICKKAKELWGDDVGTAGADELVVKWLPIGTKFFVEEYDGYESIRTEQDLTFTA